MAKPLKTAVKRITSWSISRFNDHDLCNALAGYKHVQKLKEPGNQAMQRGADIHDVAHFYIKGKGRTMPPELADFSKLFKDLRAVYDKNSKLQPIYVEENWGFARDWTPCAWDDWDNCWLRVKMDCARFESKNTLVLYDWKTGKQRPNKQEEYMRQLELYGLTALCMFPRAELKVLPRLVYLDEGTTYDGPPGAPLVYTMADVPRLKKQWERRVAPMLADTTFKPRPGRQCQYCHFRRSNGGPCRF